MEIKSHKPKDNSRKRGVPEREKARRKKEADVRAQEYAKLTPKQKLARLDVGNFAAKKQRVRLAQAITEGSAK